MDEIWNLDQTTLKILLNDLNSPEKIVSKRALITPSAPPRPKRCQKDECKTKLALTDSACKCSGFYCMKHRHAEIHSCTFDYKGEGMNKLKAQLPEVRGTKLENI
jgi:hypothetical protein